MANPKEHRSEPTQTTESEERSTALRQQAESRSGLGEGPAGLNQLREILVGATIRDLERRLARAETHMSSRAHELEQESRRRMDVIEAHLRKDAETLRARFERELEQTSEAIRAVAREHRESMADINQRAAKLEESIGRAQRELRDELLQQAKQFLDELQKLRREVTETLERELGPFEGFEQRSYGEEERRPAT